MNAYLCPTCGQSMPENLRSRAALTDGELDALSAWWHTGSVRKAADLLSRADRTIVNQLYSARIRDGVHTTLELVQVHMGELRTMRELLGSHNSTRRKAA